MKLKYIIYLSVIILTSACSNEFLETNPTNQISDQVVFTTVEGAQTVLDGISRRMRAAGQYHDQFGVKTIDLAMDMMSEDISLSASNWFGLDHQFGNHLASYPRTAYTWGLFYGIINNANSLISHIDHAKATSEPLKNNLKAQAYALRGYAYFQLIQLYQFTYKGNENALGVPIYTEVSLDGAPRASVAEVYTQITADLDEAIRLFNANPVTRRHISDISVHVAKGLRSRVALVMQDWAIAATMASEARQGYALMTPAQYSAGFDSFTEQNWIWGLVINDEQSTTFGSWFSHMDWSIGGYCGVGLSRKNWSLALFNQMNDSDIRKKLIDISQYEPLTTKNWIRPNKFSGGNGKGWAADYVLMRPEEMLLIEAEAKARLAQYPAAQSLLKQLRDTRYDQPVTISASGEQLIEEILLERRIELWGEGFAAQDLKRLKRGIDRNNSNHLPLVARQLVVPANDPRWLFKIPQAEINANPWINEEHQNP